MKKIFLATVILSVVAFIGGALYWYFVLSQKPTPDITSDTKTKPTPAVGFGNLNPYAKLCADFKKVEGEILCEEAIRIATAKYSGRAQQILHGSGFPKEYKGATSVMRGFWRIEILLDSPIQKNQEIFNAARSYIDGKTGEELAGGYTKGP